MITEVAVETENGIFTVPIGKDHNDAIYKANGSVLIRCGFIDHNGNFLDRKEAMLEAKACNQLVKSERIRNRDWLDSYDLWDMMLTITLS